MVDSRAEFKRPHALHPDIKTTFLAQGRNKNVAVIGQPAEKYTLKVFDTLASEIFEGEDLVDVKAAALKYRNHEQRLQQIFGNIGLPNVIVSHELFVGYDEDGQKKLFGFQPKFEDYVTLTPNIDMFGKRFNSNQDDEPFEPYYYYNPLPPGDSRYQQAEERVIATVQRFSDNLRAIIPPENVAHVADQLPKLQVGFEAASRAMGSSLDISGSGRGNIFLTAEGELKIIDTGLKTLMFEEGKDGNAQYVSQSVKGYFDFLRLVGVGLQQGLQKTDKTG